jgi:hypothetical protein
MVSKEVAASLDPPRSYSRITPEIQDLERHVECHPGCHLWIVPLAEQPIGPFPSGERGGRVVQPSGRTGQAVERLRAITLLEGLLKR